MPDPSPSTLTVLKNYFLQLGSEEGVVAGHRGITPGGYLSTVKHTAL